MWMPLMEEAELVVVLATTIGIKVVFEGDLSAIEAMALEHGVEVE